MSCSARQSIEFRPGVQPAAAGLSRSLEGAAKRDRRCSVDRGGATRRGGGGRGRGVDPDAQGATVDVDPHGRPLRGLAGDQGAGDPAPTVTNLPDYAKMSPEQIAQEKAASMDSERQNARPK